MLVFSQDVESFYPVDTGRELNVHKTFRRSPGHLLKVLYTFNLRPVSTGYKCLTKSSCTFIKLFMITI